MPQFIFPTETPRRFECPVTVTVPGVGAQRFTASFEELDQGDLDQFASLERGDADLVSRVLTGWSGIVDDTGTEVSFTAKRRDALVARPYARAAGFVTRHAGRAANAASGHFLTTTRRLGALARSGRRGAAAMIGLRRAMAPLGGPLGLIFLVAEGLALFVSRADKAEIAARKAAEGIAKLTRGQAQAALAPLETELAAKRAELGEVSRRIEDAEARRQPRRNRSGGPIITPRTFVGPAPEDLIPTDEIHDTLAHFRRVMEASRSGMVRRSFQAMQQASTMAS